MSNGTECLIQWFCIVNIIYTVWTLYRDQRSYLSQEKHTKLYEEQCRRDRDNTVTRAQYEVMRSRAIIAEIRVKEFEERE